ncbi:hypothetical protein WICPIJ_000569 [Wickerhamomyces pijperi]|uniref:Uncharacterized protein n=1 Tax=Wickerhamomyces pijperi TaxID=599730 RepID=A0A9P8TRR4_WICPI|nr:hypothetical protein WICPIJ_000569 [Wickerhamomyces pijperi]
MDVGHVLVLHTDQKPDESSEDLHDSNPKGSEGALFDFFTKQSIEHPLESQEHIRDHREQSPQRDDEPFSGVVVQNLERTEYYHQHAHQVEPRPIDSVELIGPEVVETEPGEYREQQEGQRWEERELSEVQGRLRVELEDELVVDLELVPEVTISDEEQHNQ